MIDATNDAARAYDNLRTAANLMLARWNAYRDQIKNEDDVHDYAGVEEAARLLEGELLNERRVAFSPDRVEDRDDLRHTAL